MRWLLQTKQRKKHSLSLCLYGSNVSGKQKIPLWLFSKERVGELFRVAGALPRQAHAQADQSPQWRQPTGQDRPDQDSLPAVSLFPECLPTDEQKPVHPCHTTLTS